MQRRLNIGDHLGEYRINAFLGAGGMGEVYHGVHAKLGRQAAIKVLLQTAGDSTFAARFANEARLQANLHHPNIATLYDFQECGGQLCIFMEFVDGECLEDCVKARSFAVEDAVKVFASIVEAIAYIHSHGIIHRDIKAANVKITSGGAVKLLDFGIAKDATTNKLTQTGGVVGTPYYLAPEQLNGGQASERTDIWALGVLFYEMLTGEVPFQGDTLAALVMQITSAKFRPVEELNPAVPKNVARIVNRCLKRNPAERYESAAELLADVKTASNPQPKTAQAFSLTNSLKSFGKTESAPNREIAPRAASNDLSSYEDGQYQPAPAKKSLPLGLIAGASAVAVLLLFAAIGIGAWMMSSAPPAKATDASASPGGKNSSSFASAAKTGAPRRVKIDVDEGKAEILRGGQPVGTTPFDLEARDGEKIDLTLKRDGFEDKNVQIEVTPGKQAYTFSLKQK